MSYLVDFQPLALKAMRLEALLPTKALTAVKDRVHIDRDTVRLILCGYTCSLFVCNNVGKCGLLLSFNIFFFTFLLFKVYCNDIGLYVIGV